MTDTKPSSTDLANAVRALAMDAVQQANSGHPGAPMGMAEMAVALFKRHLRYNPLNPAWPNRDRFVLSNGHASMLLYAVLHLTGFDVSLDDIKQFRQLHSKTPGHPEVGITAGVETTTGPLGQGIGNAVGFALAEKLLASEFNQPDYPIVDHFTYAFVGDGCLMEGISHEVCSFAGTLKLNKLVVLYDDNGISIDGQVKNWFADNTPERFKAYGWQVIENVDGHDVQAIEQAIAQAHHFANDPTSGPTLICCKTVIGKGAPHMAGTEKVHGSPLGAEEIAATRQAMGWTSPAFHIPEDIAKAWNHQEAGKAEEVAWQAEFDQYKKAYPDKAVQLERRLAGQLPAEFAQQFQAFLDQTVQEAQTVASRKASQRVIQAVQAFLPEFLGGSADLTGSNYTDWKGVQAVRADHAGRHINYGVREFGMAAIMNGIALHGGYLPFGGTFLTFSDYSRNAIRMAALMKQRVVHVFTHDSIGLGEDGPTHQSIEHASSLRLIPNLDVWRPCDTTETAVAWRCAIERPASLGLNVQDGGPSALLLSRQNLPFVDRTPEQVDQIAKGGYVLREAPQGQVAKAQLIATGSEVGLALQTQDLLAEQGIYVRVVSMPSTSVFDRQPQAWQESVLPADLPSISIEAGSTGLWYKYVGRQGLAIGIDRYGESAPAGQLFEYFGLTAPQVAQKVKDFLLGE